MKILPIKIAVVDDEKNITDVCRRYLEREGYLVFIADTGEDALQLWKEEQPDLFVLDVMMPKKDGLEVCEEIRNVDDVPIIMLTARSEEVDRLMGLTMGADDYMTKPFSPRELVLRIKAIFRRMNVGKARTHQSTFRFGDLIINEETRTVSVGDRFVDLTVKEFDLLYLLVSYPNRAFSRSELLDKIWDIDFYGDTTTVTVHIRRLREKLEQTPSEPIFIKTVWGVGYKFDGSDSR
jgi:two-component system, OmpR family, response regulator VicR